MNYKRVKYSFLVIVFALANNLIFAQNKVRNYFIVPQLNTVAVRVFDMSNVSLGSKSLVLNLAVDAKLKHTFDFGVGYIYRSYDEGVSARGYSWLINYKKWVRRRDDIDLGYSLGYEYQKATINDFLLVGKTLGGLNFGEYQNVVHQKYRHAYKASWILNQSLGAKWFLGLTGGVKIVSFITETPHTVIQQDFRNGLFYGKNMVVPAPEFSISVGYKIFNAPKEQEK